MAEDSRAASSRLRHLAPVFPIAAGAAFLAGLAFLLHAPVHIAGDGALKQYQLESWIENGRITSEIAWRSPEPWTRSLWREFHYPFEAPFVYEGRVVFPPFFLLLSLPFFHLFGYAGLFVLPALSLAGLWGIVLWLLRRMNVSGPAAGLALAVLVLSPLTYFGMMFWEHTPGLLALFAALAILARSDERQVPDVVAGFLLALAVMLRPELVVAAAVLFVFFLWKVPRRFGAIPGVAAGLLVWSTVNALVTGAPMGIHARQPLYLSGGDAAAKLLAYYSGLGTTMTAGASAAVAGLVLAAVFLKRETDETSRRLTLGLLLAVAGTLLTLPLMIPYTGEYMGFRRFELLLIPAGALLAGRVASRYRWALIVLAALCVLQGPRFFRQLEIFRWANGARLAPVIEAVEAESPSAVIGDSQFTAIELASQMDEVPLLWAPPPSELTRLLGEVVRRSDLDRAAIVFWRPGPSTSLTIPVEGRGPVQWGRVAGDDEGFALFMPQ